MHVKQERLSLLLPLILISSIFFIIGCGLIFALSTDSPLFMGLYDGILSFLDSNSSLQFEQFFKMLCSLMIFEIKFLAISLCICFSIYRYKLLAVVCSTKGIVAGIGCSIFLRLISSITQNQEIKIAVILGALGFVTCTVLCCLILCCFCTRGLFFSQKTILPIRLKTLFKRKDTYSFIFDLLAIFGIITLINTVKLVSLLLALS